MIPIVKALAVCGALLVLAHLPAGGQELSPDQQKRLKQSRLDSERAAAVARTQHRLSETAPPQSVGQDRNIRDPSLRRHVRGSNSPVHP